MKNSDLHMGLVQSNEGHPTLSICEKGKLSVFYYPIIMCALLFRCVTMLNKSFWAQLIYVHQYNKSFRT